MPYDIYAILSEMKKNRYLWQLYMVSIYIPTLCFDLWFMQVMHVF